MNTYTITESGAPRRFIVWKTYIDTNTNFKVTVNQIVSDVRTREAAEAVVRLLQERT